MTLLEECLLALENYNIFGREEKDKMFTQLLDSFPFNKWGSIDWDRVQERRSINTVSKLLEELKDCLNESIFVIWDEVTLPIVSSNLVNILNCLEDVTAVSFDTWLYNPNKGFVIEFHHEGKVNLGYLNEVKKWGNLRKEIESI